MTELNKEVRDQLKFGVDEDDDLTSHIDQGKYYLNTLAGVNLDFIENLLAKSLLVNYVRYSYNNASEYFAENFREDILRLQLLEGVNASENQE